MLIGRNTLHEGVERHVPRRSKLSPSDVFFTAPLEEVDPEIFGSIPLGARAPAPEIELIASGVHRLPRRIAAQGSIMTNKYAEGYPGKRYYGGCSSSTSPRRGDRGGPRKLSGPPRQRSAELRLQMNQAVFLALLQPGRYLHGPRPELGRPSHARVAGQTCPASGFKVDP